MGESWEADLWFEWKWTVHKKTACTDQYKIIRGFPRSAPLINFWCFDDLKLNFQPFSRGNCTEICYWLSKMGAFAERRTQSSNQEWVGRSFRTLRKSAYLKIHIITQVLIKTDKNWWNEQVIGENIDLNISFRLDRSSNYTICNYTKQVLYLYPFFPSQHFVRV